MKSPIFNPRDYVSPKRRHDRKIFYKYMPISTAQIVLVNKTLRWSSPKIFNDPLDIQENMLPFSQNEIEQVFKKELVVLLGNPHAVEFCNERLACLHKRMQEQPDLINHNPSLLEEFNFPESKSFKNLRHILSSLVLDMRILCLSETHNLISMWNDYAEEATGVVLEFEVLDYLDCVTLLAQPVIYDDSPPAITRPEEWARRMLQFKGKDIEKAGFQMLSEYEHTKTTKWEGEREWRVVSGKRKGEEEGLYSDDPFDSRELVGVYIGWNCTEDDRKLIRNLLNYDLSHVKIFNTSLDTKERKIIFQELSCL